MALTDLAVKRAKSADKPYKLSYGGRLFLWVTPAGGKIWRWAFAFKGKEKLMTFGKYPDVSLAQARERHSDARKLLATGIDPMAERKTRKTVERVALQNSFANISALWFEHWRHGKSLRHVDSTRRRLAANILPCLGELQAEHIEAPQIVSMVRAIQERGARDIAKRTLETTGQIFRFAVVHGYSSRNPATEIKPRDILKACEDAGFLAPTVCRCLWSP